MSPRKHLLPKRLAAAAVFAFLLSLPALHAGAVDFSRYHNYAEMTAALKEMAKAYPALARIRSIGKTVQDRDIWLMEIANTAGAAVESRPALLITATFEGDHMIGSELALFTIDFLLKNYASSPEVKQSLDNQAFYVIPRVNPDAAEEMFAAVKTGRRTNFSARDDDNDGRLDEDGPEDLNLDGWITLMRARRPDGEYLVDPAEPRLMKKAEAKKGETGQYKLYWEGIDNDNDGFVNEDGPGGADINRNFMHDYPYFKADAGRMIAAEPESRAILEWIIGHRNIAQILAFGESDNLVVPPNVYGRLSQPKEIDLFRFANAGNAAADKVGMMPAMPFGSGRFTREMIEMGDFIMTPEMLSRFMGGQPTTQAASSSQAATGTQAAAAGRMRLPDRQAPTTVNTADIDYFKTVSDKYIEITGIKQCLTVREPQGAFFQYGYYQYGVPAYSTPGWGLNVPDPAASFRSGMMPGGSQGQGADRSTPRSFDMQALAAGAARDLQAPAPVPGVDKQVIKWLDSEKIDGFVPWTKFQHPHLGEVEIGGFKPYALTNPPAAKIADLGQSHAKFALYLASLFPHVFIADTAVTDLGGGLFRITAEIVNNGFLPTALAHTVTARAVKPTLVQLDVAPESILSGNAKVNLLPSLAGSGGREKYLWIIRGKHGDSVQLKTVAEKGGTDLVTLVLK